MSRITLSLCLFLVLSACKRAEETKKVAEKPQARANGPSRHVDACSLVTKEEVSAIQGAPMIEPTSSEGPQSDLVLSQCYYGSTEANMSVSLGVFQGDSDHGGKETIAHFWHETFDRFKGEEEEEKERAAKKPGKRDGEEEHEGARAKKIEGLGEEAYWSASPIGGVLYVLQNDKILRVSIGGPGDMQSKIDKSKALAGKALDHF